MKSLLWIFFKNDPLITTCRTLEQERVFRWGFCNDSGIEARRCLAVGSCRKRRRKNLQCMREEVITMAGRNVLIVSNTLAFRHLLRWAAAHPEGTSSFCFLWSFLVHTIYTLAFIPLCIL